MNEVKDNQHGTGTDSRADEVDLADYFTVLWKYKYFIVLASILLAVIAFSINRFALRRYKLSYTYNVQDSGLTEDKFNVLQDWFYSSENTERIITGLPLYIPENVQFNVQPLYVDTTKRKSLRPEDIVKFRQLKAQLLNMTVIGKSEEELSKSSPIIRANFENVIPVYSIEEQLADAVRKNKTDMAAIEKSRFNLQLTLKTGRNVLAGLERIETKDPEQFEGNVVLQFDVGGKSEYLPVAYQVRAVNLQIVDIEGEIKANEQKYAYYAAQLKINESLHEVLKNRAKNYTIQDYHLFLTGMAADFEQVELADYLNSYIKTIENQIASGFAVIQNPRAEVVGKGNARKKALIVFVMALFGSTFAVFLIEGARKSRA